ncbi:hypothetical protein B0T21DRAFT_419398, partial [Apiosordaria backusii]
TTKEIDTFFLFTRNSSRFYIDPNEEYVLRPPPAGRNPPRDEQTKMKRSQDKWMGGYKGMSPCQLPRPVKEVVVVRDRVERETWVGVRVDKGIARDYVPEGEDFSDSDEDSDEEIPNGQEAGGGQNDEGGQQGEAGIQGDPKGKGKAVEDEAAYNKELHIKESNNGETEDEDGEEDELPDEGTTKKTGRRERLKEKIRSIRRSLAVRKRPTRMRERKDQTPGPNGRKA